MRLSELLRVLPLPAKLTGPDVEVHDISADSRRVEPGHLFIAIPGMSSDGHQFIGEALRRGAVAVMGEVPWSTLTRPSGANFAYVRVPDSREGWAWASSAWQGFPSRAMTMIGVTGTDGKTTTVSLCHAILRAAGMPTGMMSTVKALIPAASSSGAQDVELETGLHTTTPDPPEIQRYLRDMVRRGATHAVLEVTSHGLAQHRVGGCSFDVAAVTNITHEHLDYHGSLEAYQEAKASLFAGLDLSYRKPGVPKISVLNRDDASFVYLKHYAADRIITYSREADATLTAEEIRLDSDRTRFTLCTPLGCRSIETQLVGAYNVSNALAAAGVGLGLGLPLEAIAEGIASVGGVPGRMERIDEGQPFLAIVDFAHTPNALEEALRATRGMISERGRVIVVFGSAGLRDRAKRRLMGAVAGRLADVVVITAEDPRVESLEGIIAESAQAAEAEGKRLGLDLFLVPDRGRAIRTACEIASPGDVVIACGKGHEQSMCFGTTEYPWDDRRAMRLALRGQTLDTLPTAAPDEPE